MKKLSVLSYGIVLTLVALLVVAKAQGQNAADLRKQLDILKAYPDMILVNGKVSTMDSQTREVQALAVRGGRILAMGTTDEMRFLAGPKTEVIDAKGRRVVPGLIDAHTHPHLWLFDHRLGAEGDITARKYNDPELKIVLVKGNNQAELLRGLEAAAKARAQELGPGKWILVRLFSGNSIPESRKVTVPLFATASNTGPITTQYLDTIAPDNPLMLFATEAIGSYASNSKAKEQMRKFLGYDDLNMLLARTRGLWDILLAEKTEVGVDLLKTELLECLAAQGITTFANHYYGTSSIQKIYNLLYQRGQLPVRYSWYQGNLWPAQYNDDPNLIPFFFDNVGDARGIGNDYIWNAGVASEVWENRIQCTKAKPPQGKEIPANVYQSCPENMNYAEMEKAGGYKNVKSALEAGLRMTFLHGYGDGVFDGLFHIFDDLQKEGKMNLEQIRALRLSVEHAPVIRPEQAEKMGYYRMQPALQGYQVQGDIKGGAFLKAYGEQYMTWMLPVKTMITAGAHPVISTDAHVNGKIPVEWKDMDYPPQWDGNVWGYIEFFVTRRMPHDGITYNKAEAIDRTTALRAATIWAAERELNEKNIGSLEVGKLADFLVIDKDYFAVPEDQIGTIKTLLTSVGGTVVFKAPNY
ncbi:MAG: amidohydrolase family protein [Acidobacteria bacterium]|nr:amidohydrolase family protein [Acidobacteriota bacterium]